MKGKHKEKDGKDGHKKKKQFLASWRLGATHLLVALLEGFQISDMSFEELVAFLQLLNIGCFTKIVKMFHGVTNVEMMLLVILLHASLGPA